MERLWRVLASVCFCALMATTASAQATPDTPTNTPVNTATPVNTSTPTATFTATPTVTNTPTDTATPTATSTGTPLPTAPGVRQGVSVMYPTPMLTVAAPTPGIPVDVHGYGSATAQIVVGACSGSFTLVVEGRLDGTWNGTWSPLATYTKGANDATHINANSSAIVPITPFPLGWVRLNPTGVSSCVLSANGALRP